MFMQIYHQDFFLLSPDVYSTMKITWGKDEGQINLKVIKYRDILEETASTDYS